jgi:cell division ATPase FtsA
MLDGMAEYAKESLGLAAKIGVVSGYGGVADGIDKPEFATAVGLMLIDAESGNVMKQSKKFNGKNAIVSGAGMLSRLLGRFRA